MIALLQRVTEGRVEINGAVVGQIGAGLVVLLAVERMDTGTQADRMVDRLLGYRVFEDTSGRMNLSLVDTGGSLLLIPQFTLAADCGKGNRPSFDSAENPSRARELYEKCITGIRQEGIPVATGVFAAMMQVHLVNDGPVTFLVDSRR